MMSLPLFEIFCSLITYLRLFIINTQKKPVKEVNTFSEPIFTLTFLHNFLEKLKTKIST